MRHLVAQRWSRRTAIVAALMMCVQLLAGSFLLGAAAAAPPMIDAYGNPLCITSAHGPADEKGKDHSGLPDCCAPGCMMFAPVKDTDREPLVLSNPLAASVRTTIVRLFVLDARPVEHDPGHPRAPPSHG